MEENNENIIEKENSTVAVIEKTEKIEIVQDAIKQKKVGLVERRNILKRVIAKLRAIIETFSWD